MLAVIDGKPMVTRVAVCKAKTTFTCRQLPHSFHYLLFSFFAIVHRGQRGVSFATTAILQTTSPSLGVLGIPDREKGTSNLRKSKQAHGDG